jgi:hypothetical protein
MGVGLVGGGGRKGGAGGAGGAKGGGAAGKAGGGFAGKVGKGEGLVGPSGLVGGGNVGGADPVSAQALDIARMLKSGEIKTRQEATKRLVATILRDKVKSQSKTLQSKIADVLQDDPRLSQALERLWERGAED